MAILSGTINIGPDFRTAPHFGLFGDFRFTETFALQPEVIYSGQGFHLAFRGGQTTTSLNYLNIPVIAKIYVGNKFFLQAGPQLGILLSGRLKGTDSPNNVKIDEDVKKSYKSPDISLCFGLGVDFLKRFNLSGRYNMGITDLTNDSWIKSIRKAEGLGPLTNRVIQLSVGVKLGKIE